MTGNFTFSSLIRWLASTEMFARPSKQLPGKWRLVEYYTEPKNQLINVKEEDIKRAGYVWEVIFRENGRLYQIRNLPVDLSNETINGEWSVSQNFVVLSAAEIPGMKEEFQFAVEKGILKMLKKDADGRIQFFGLFRRIDGEKKVLNAQL